MRFEGSVLIQTEQSVAWAALVNVDSFKQVAAHVHDIDVLSERAFRLHTSIDLGGLTMSAPVDVNWTHVVPEDTLEWDAVVYWQNQVVHSTGRFHLSTPRAFMTELAFKIDIPNPTAAIPKQLIHMVASRVIRDYLTSLKKNLEQMAVAAD